MSTDRVNREAEGKYIAESKEADRDKWRLAAHLFWMLTGYRVTAVEESKHKPTEHLYDPDQG